MVEPGAQGEIGQKKNWRGKILKRLLGCEPKE